MHKHAVISSAAVHPDVDIVVHNAEATSFFVKVGPMRTNVTSLQVSKDGAYVYGPGMKVVCRTNLQSRTAC